MRHSKSCGHEDLRARKVNKLRLEHTLCGSWVTQQVKEYLLTLRNRLMFERLKSQCYLDWHNPVQYVLLTGSSRPEHADCGSSPCVTRATCKLVSIISRQYIICGNIVSVSLFFYIAILSTFYISEGWGLSHGNFFFFCNIDIDHKETWKYTNGSWWC